MEEFIEQSNEIINSLKISKYRFISSPIEEIILPEYKGSTFRGAFGNSFRNICCVHKQKNCNECLLNNKCAYSIIFESSPVIGSEKLKNLDEIPRPFVIEPPLTEKRYFNTEDELTFELVLIGRANEYLHLMIYTFIELGKVGIGKHRGRFKINKIITETDDIIYDGETETMYNINSIIKINIPEIKDGNILKISFLTPTRIKYEGYYQNKPEFHIIIRTLLRRISSLMYFYCNKELNVNFKELISKSENVKIIDNNLRWIDWERYSSRQNIKMKLGGIVGEIVYEGDFKQFLPFLVLGEYIHIGKNCTFGLGKYKLVFNRKK